jgi:hypothetical protein
VQDTHALYKRVEAKILKVDGCWRFTGATSSQGYGHFQHDGRMLLAHRFFYEYHVGPIPVGLEIDHRCRFRNCVNPEHLEPVTHAENMRRSRLTHCHRGHEFTPENTYIRPAKHPRRVCRACRNEWAAARKARLSA